MQEKDADRIEMKTGSVGIQSEAGGLYYFFNEEAPGEVAIAAKRMVILTKKQAKAILKELPDILNLYL